MAFPVIETSNTTADTSSTSVTVNMPASISAGDLLIVICAQDAVGTITQSGGSDWTKLEQTNEGGSQVSQAMFAKIAAGGDSLTLTSTDSQDMACVAIRITGHGVSNVSTDITRGTPATGTDASPNPPNCNPAVAKDFLWIECFAADDDDDTTPYESANYTAVAQIQSANSASSCLCAVAFRNLNTSSENPGVMALNATEEWIAQTLAISPASTSQVTQTWSLRHDLSSSISQLWNLRHDLSSQILQTWSLRHDLSSSISQLWNLRHDLNSSILQTWNLRHDLAAQIEQIWNLRHDLSSSITQIWNIRHDLGSAISQIWDLRHDLSSSVLQAWFLRHDLSGTISRTWSLRHDLNSSILQTWNLRHDLTNSLNQVWTLRYDLVNSVSQTWSLRHDLLGDISVSQIWNLRYDLYSFVSQIWTLRHKLLEEQIIQTSSNSGGGVPIPKAIFMAKMEIQYRLSERIKYKLNIYSKIERIFSSFIINSRKLNLISDSLQSLIKTQNSEKIIKSNQKSTILNLFNKSVKIKNDED